MPFKAESGNLNTCLFKAVSFFDFWIKLQIDYNRMKWVFCYKSWNIILSLICHYTF